LFEEAKARSRDKPIQAEHMAALYAAAGDNKHAFEWLQKAVQERALSFVPAYNRCDPRFESLRGDSRFNDLLRRIGLPP